MKTKKIVVVLFFFFSCLLGYSQKKSSGRIVLQGLVNPLSSLKTKNDFTVAADMRVGYFIKRRITVGLNLETNLWKSKDDYFMNTNVYVPSSIKLKGQLNMYSAGSFMRYYIYRKKFVFFPEAGFGAAFLNWQYKAKKMMEGSEKYFYIKYGVGLNYFLLDNVAFEVLVTHRRNDIGYIPLSYYYPKEKISATIGFSLFIP